MLIAARDEIGDASVHTPHLQEPNAIRIGLEPNRANLKAKSCLVTQWRSYCAIERD